jgi:hypothetical protein
MVFRKLPIGKKVVKDLLREKTIMFTILLQVFIILASSVILTNSNALFNPETIVQDAIGFGVYGLNKTALVDDPVIDEFINILEVDDKNIIYVKRYETKTDAIKEFEEHKVDVLIGFSAAKDPYLVKVSLPKGEIRTSVAMTIVKEKLEQFEDYLRHKNLVDDRLIKLSLLNVKNKATSASASLFEALYNIIIPFLILLPGILLGGLVIDILFEDLETKTINLLMIITTFRKYIYEILLTVMILASAQVLLWEMMLIAKGIFISHLPLITSMTIFLDLILFMIAILLTLLFNEKTRAQITYSFVIILMFVSAPLTKYNPIRMITKLAIGLEQTQFFIYMGVLVALIAIFTGIVTYVAEKKEW